MVNVDEALVAALLCEQHPDLADLSLTRLSAGWDNVMFRLGDDYVVRVPHREMSAPLVDFEVKWLPVLSARLPLPVPAPVRAGRPGCGFPWSWAICPWLPGRNALSGGLLGERHAAQLGGFLRALHHPAPADAPVNPYRGVPLADRDDAVRGRIERLASLIDVAPVTAAWEQALAVASWSGEPMWLHGDLHPGNILIDDRSVTAVIDFGDLTSGDPATDLSMAWMLFDAPTRQVFKRAVGEVDNDTWARAQGWCVALALAYLESPDDNQAMVPVGRAALAAALTRDR